MNFEKFKKIKKSSRDLFYLRSKTERYGYSDDSNYLVYDRKELDLFFCYKGIANMMSTYKHVSNTFDYDEILSFSRFMDVDNYYIETYD